MAVDPHDIYREILQQPAQIPDSVQRRILKWCRTHKQFDTLALLALRTDLLPEIDATLATIDSSVVQAAYIARPGRSAEELSIMARKDKRVAVQSILATRPDLDAAAYTALAKSKSRKVAFPLIENTAAPLATRSTAMAGLVTNLNSASSYELQRFKDVMGAFPDMGEPAIVSVAQADGTPGAATGRARLIECYFGLSMRSTTPTASFDLLSDDAARSLCTMLVKQCHKDAAALTAYSGRYGAYSYVSRVQSVLAQITTAAGRIAIDASMRAQLLAAIDEAAEALRGPNGNNTSETNDLIEESRAAMTDSIQQELERLAAVTDPAELLAAAHRVKPSTATAKTIVAAIAHNPAADAEVLRVLLEKVPGEFVWKLVTPRLTETDLAAELLFRLPHYIQDSVLERTGDPVAVIGNLCRRRCDSFVWRLADCKYLTPEMAGMLPVVWFDTPKEHKTPREMVAMGHALAYIIEQLGDDQLAWDMFEEFVPQAPGSIDQLLDQIRRLQRRPV